MAGPSNSFCFAPTFNHPGHRDKSGVFHPSYDATGAFLPYMKAFYDFYISTGLVSTFAFNNHASAAGELHDIAHAMSAAPSGLDAVVYFGHGWPTGLISADVYTPDIPKLAKLIRGNCSPGVKIVLYACLCGDMSAKGGCFAANLAAELSDMQAEVFGHSKAGHCATNPYIYRFVGSQPGVPLAPAGMFHKFDTLLKAECLDTKPRHNNAFWARIPFMRDDEIAAEVKGYKPH